VANFLVRWRPNMNTKSYVNVLSAIEIKEWAHEYATYYLKTSKIISASDFLRSNASVKECIKFLDSHNVYVTATKHRGPLKNRRTF